MNLSLKFKLIFSYIAVALFLVISLLYVSNYFLNIQFQTYISNKQSLKNQEIVNIITDSYNDDGFPPTRRFFMSLGNNLLNQEIILKIHDQDGRELLDMQRFLYRGGGMHRMHSNNNVQINTENYQEETFPIIKNNQQVASVTLAYPSAFSLNAVDAEFITSFNSIFIGTALLVLIIAIVIAVFMATRIVNPIKKVIKRAQHISNGDYYDRINLKTNTKEIDELTTSIDNLAESLEQQTKIKQRMANDYSHEFRTPLTTLQTNLEAMIDGIWQPTPERLESLKDEVLRLSRMVSELDKLVQIREQKNDLHKTDFDLDVITTKILQIFAVEIAQKNIHVHYNNAPCMINADSDKLEQVIINLLSNAIKHTNENGNITLKTVDEEKQIIFTIQDDGIGIAKEDLPHIFEYLYRTDKSRSRDTGGNGIGLSVVKTIVENHKGTISVTSQQNQGTIFTITLPKA